jgi:hypothetical protein
LPPGHGKRVPPLWWGWRRGDSGGTTWTNAFVLDRFGYTTLIYTVHVGLDLLISWFVNYGNLPRIRVARDICWFCWTIRLYACGTPSFWRLNLAMHSPGEISGGSREHGCRWGDEPRVFHPALL